MGEKILIVGSTGYIGKYIAKASLSLGYPTTLLVRSSTYEDKSKSEFLDYAKSAGANIIYGSVEDQESLIAAIKQSDVVISALGGTQILDQLKLIEAMKEAGNVKRFLPSEFGNDPAKAKKTLPVLEYALGPKLQVRKTVADSGIPYTIVSSNCFAGYFLANLVQPDRFTPPLDMATIWGNGNTKAIVVSEEDIGKYVVKAAVDPRTLNKAVYVRPASNILSQNEMVALWEKKIGKVLDKTYVQEEAILKNIEETPFPNNIMPAIVHAIFVQGDQYGFDVELEATQLYPDVKYTTAEEYLSRF